MLSDRVITAGRLTNRITLQRKVASGQDDYGAPQTTWADVATVWAAVEPLTGREFWAAQQVQSEASILIIIRYRSDVTPDMRAVMDSRTFSIMAPPIDWRERHEYLQLMCGEGVLDLS